MEPILSGSDEGLEHLHERLSLLWWPERADQVEKVLRKLSPAMAADTGRNLALFEDPTLPLPVRRLLTIVMLATLGRENELRTHILGALANGVSSEEIEAALFQLKFYAGTPAAMEAFVVLRRAEKELAQERPAGG